LYILKYRYVHELINAVFGVCLVCLVRIHAHSAGISSWVWNDHHLREIMHRTTEAIRQRPKPYMQQPRSTQLPYRGLRNRAQAYVPLPSQSDGGCLLVCKDTLKWTTADISCLIDIQRKVFAGKNVWWCLSHHNAWILHKIHANSQVMKYG
jgi:hypothetical protein